MQFNRIRTRASLKGIWGTLCVALAASVSFGAVASAQGGAPEPDGFSPYWPGSCVQAVYRSNSFFWRDKQDSTVFTVQTDTMLASSKALAVQCLSELDMSSVQNRDRAPLIAAYLAAGDDASATQVADDAVKAAASLTGIDHGFYLSQIVGVYLGAKPARLDRAREIVSVLDKLTGADAAVGKVAAYSSLAYYYWTAGDFSNMTGASERVVALGKELPDNERIANLTSLLTAYRYLAEAAGARTGDSAAPLAIISRATQDVGKIDGAMRAIRSYQMIFRSYGDAGQRLVADNWLLAQRDTIFPSPGRFTLVVHRPFRNMIPYIKRIGEKYAANLDIVGITGTSGYFKNIGPINQQMEADYLKKQFTEEFNFLGSLALNYTEFNKLPDGRRQAEQSPNERAYRNLSGATIVLVDPQGIIRRVWMRWHPSYEARIDEAVQQWSR